jgi:hypothetical protein
MVKSASVPGRAAFNASPRLVAIWIGSAAPETRLRATRIERAQQPSDCSRCCKGHCLRNLDAAVTRCWRSCGKMDRGDESMGNGFFAGVTGRNNARRLEKRNHKVPADC